MKGDIDQGEQDEEEDKDFDDNDNENESEGEDQEEDEGEGDFKKPRAQGRKRGRQVLWNDFIAIDRRNKNGLRMHKREGREIENLPSKVG